MSAKSVTIHWRQPGKDKRNFASVDVITVRNGVLILKDGKDGWRFPLDLIEEIRTRDLD